MRALFLAPIVVAMLAGPSYGQTVEGAARLVSSLIAVKSACGKIMRIDQDKASDLAAGIIKGGGQIYGDKAFDAALSSDIDRRRSDIETTGAKQWCAYQRAYYKKNGMKGIFVE